MSLLMSCPVYSLYDLCWRHQSSWWQWASLKMRSQTLYKPRSTMMSWPPTCCWAEKLQRFVCLSSSTLSRVVNALCHVTTHPMSLHLSSRGASPWLTASWGSASDRPVTSTTAPAFLPPIPRSRAASRPIRSSAATVIMVGMMMVVVVVVVS